ncbi:MAG: sulfatase-like hydrolase/transferase [Planctomycetota bacterium]|nr:sulfatase-like hydrolase/transferase [Planctomycetota bacterium]
MNKVDELRRKSGGKPPNFVYILLDDVGFGELGMPNMSFVRGYKTPRISQLATKGLTFHRMYTEPSCTPTQVAMMTGRHPFRTGLDEAKVTLAGDGRTSSSLAAMQTLISSRVAFQTM